MNGIFSFFILEQRALKSIFSNLTLFRGTPIISTQRELQQGSGFVVVAVVVVVVVVHYAKERVILIGFV